MAEHLMTVTYTIHDDGLWVECSCGWEQPAGFSPSPEDLLSLAETHRGAAS